MKKIVIGIILTISMIATLTACGGAVPTATAEAPANVDTATETTEEKAETIAEDPCKDGHTWVEATCTEPKTCSVCGATEGEALGHEWLENTPNYQQAKTCSVCGATEGDPLEAEFEKKGISVVSEWNKPYPFTAICYNDSSKTTEGKVTFENMKTVDSDSDLELDACDGYIWILFDNVVTFDDDNAKQFGFDFSTIAMDYYDSYNVYDVDSTDSFTVKYDGVEYPECKMTYGEMTEGWDKESGVYTNTLPTYVRIPSGYDGIIIETLAGEALAKHREEKDTNVIELLDDSCVNFRVIAK